MARSSPAPVSRLAGIAVLVFVLVAAGGLAVFLLLQRQVWPVHALSHAMTVDPARMAVVDPPDWLTGPLQGPISRALFQDLVGKSPEPFSLLDDTQALALSKRWQASAWVEAVSLKRVFPDRYQATFTLRRPEAWVAVSPSGTGAGRRVLLDGRGLRLPDPDVLPGKADEFFGVLPRVAGTLLAAHLGEPGDPVRDRSVVAAAQVAAEYRQRFAPLLPCPLPLVEVDATNFEYRYLRSPERAEIRVVVRTADGELAALEWGHAPGSALGRQIPPETKAEVARRIHGRCPGFARVASADLRLRNLWEQWLRLRPD